MAHVIFYEKPGCGTNARQKLALAAAGHTVEARNLLTEPWTADRLASFFGATPVESWFNPAAPKIKSGVVDPAALAADAALALMLAEPLLIRRPLVDCDGARCAGFDRAPVTTLLDPVAARPPGPALQDCSRPHADTPCPAPAAPAR